MNKKLKTWLLILSIPIAYALLVRFVFGLWFLRYTFTVMSVSFLLGLPFGVGFLTIFLSPVESVRSYAYRIVAPMLPIIVFFIFTLAFGIEGWGPSSVKVLSLKKWSKHMSRREKCISA